MEKYFGPQKKSYMDFVKSVEGVTGIAMVVLMTIAFTLATPWFRRNKLKLPGVLKKITGFNAFWYSHHLFVIVYSLLIVHGYYVYLIDTWSKKTVSNLSTTRRNVQSCSRWNMDSEFWYSCDFIRHGCT